MEVPTIDLLQQIELVERDVYVNKLEKSLKPGGFGNSLFQSVSERDKLSNMAKSYGPNFKKKKQAVVPEKPLSPRTKKRQ